MANLVSIRSTLVQRFVDNFNHPEYDVFYENVSEADPATVSDHFIAVEVSFDDAQQINIDPNPNVRLYGEISFFIYSKATLGTVTTLSIADELSGLYTNKTLGAVHCGVSRVSKARAPAGWNAIELHTRFFADSNA